jgi:hypothetical protein
MAVVVTIEDGVIVGRFTDNLDVADFFHAGNAVKAIDRVTPGWPRLIDLTDITGTNIAFAPVARFSDERRHWNLSKQVRTAILAPSESGQGVAQLLLSMLAHPTIHLEVFRDRTAALDWLAASSPAVPARALTGDEPASLDLANERLGAGLYILATHDGPVRARLAAAFQLTLSGVLSRTLPETARPKWDYVWTVITDGGTVDAGDPHALARCIEALEPDQAVRVVEQILAVESIVADALRPRT